MLSQAFSMARVGRHSRSAPDWKAQGTGHVPPRLRLVDEPWPLAAAFMGDGTPLDPMSWIFAMS